MSPYAAFPPPYGSGVAFVTGAGGFIGTHVAGAVRDAGWRVAGFGHRPSTIAQPLGLALPDRFEIGAVTSEGLARVAADIAWPEIVIHAAGGATVVASISAPEDDFARNVESVREMLAFLRQHPGQCRLVFLSSAAVYGDGGESITEATPTCPLSPYGEHKLLAENLIREDSEKGVIEASIVRFFSVYGPGNRKQLPWEIATHLASGEHRLELFGTGMEARDFLYVSDAVDLIGIVAGLKQERLPPVINGGSGTGTTVLEVAKCLSGAMGIDAEVVLNGKVRTGDPKRLVSDPALARSLGFSPKTDLSAGLAAFAAWARRDLCGDSLRA